MRKPYVLIEPTVVERSLPIILVCGLIAHHFDLFYPFKVLNIPCNDPILAKENFAIAPIGYGKVLIGAV